MKEVNIDCLGDLYEDFQTSFFHDTVDLTDTLICQVTDIKHRDADTDTACLCVTSPQAMSQERKKLAIPHKASAALAKAGVFYQAGKRRYLPTQDVQCHCMYDYFGVHKAQTLNRMAPTGYGLDLAAKFRQVKQITFIAARPSKGFCSLVGMHSISAANQQDTLMEIAKAFDGRPGARFFTDHTEFRHAHMEFSALCDAGVHDVNGIPVMAMVKDNVTARKSLSISAVACLGGRLYVLGSMRVNHRSRTDGKHTAQEALGMLESYRGKALRLDVPQQEAIQALLPYVPRKGREKFSSFVLNSQLEPIEAAYDAAGTGIFNLMGKSHKTQSYDGGRSKYEAALGKLLLA